MSSAEIAGVGSSSIAAGNRHRGEEEEVEEEEGGDGYCGVVPSHWLGAAFEDLNGGLIGLYGWELRHKYTVFVPEMTILPLLLKCCYCDENSMTVLTWIDADGLFWG